MKAPTRALVVEDIDNWVYTLDRAARRAGASEVVICKNLQMVRDALRIARFDIAILDVGLDPDDDMNADGIKALEAIREIDDGGTQCVLITGWRGDRMSLQAEAQRKYGIDWAFMKERYEAHAVIAKLGELLELAPERRLSLTTPMANLSADLEPFRFENQLLDTLFPNGGVNTLYTLVSRLLKSAIPFVAMNPAKPMEQGPPGTWIGVYWSRTLATAIAVGLSRVDVWQEEGTVPPELRRLIPEKVEPDFIESVRERHVEGRIWELPALDRDQFPG